MRPIFTPNPEESHTLHFFNERSTHLSLLSLLLLKFPIFKLLSVRPPCHFTTIWIISVPALNSLLVRIFPQETWPCLPIYLHPSACASRSVLSAFSFQSPFFLFSSCLWSMYILSLLSEECLQESTGSIFWTHSLPLPHRINFPTSYTVRTQWMLHCWEIMLQNVSAKTQNAFLFLAILWAT